MDFDNKVEPPKTRDVTETGTAQHNSNESSLNLSITPPLSDSIQHKSSDSSEISEHLSSIENDRSVQEIEVEPIPLETLLENRDVENISQETKPQSMTNSSNDSLGNLLQSGGNSPRKFENMEETIDGVKDRNVKSILEEIVDNEHKSQSQSQISVVPEKENKEEELEDDLDIDFSTDTLDNEGINKKIREYEELLLIKDNTIEALTTELDSFRDLKSNSLGTNTTDYKTFQEYHSLVTEYQNALSQKDEEIKKLTESLEKTVKHYEELKIQGDILKSDIIELETELKKTKNILKEKDLEKKQFDSLEKDFEKFEKTLNSSQTKDYHDFKNAIIDYVSRYYPQHRRISNDNDVENIKQELEMKHAKEMEELRTYFERKCADLEKNYSEEVFSQHSRKLSNSSSISEAELGSDFQSPGPGPGGDTIILTKVDYTKNDMLKLKNDLNKIIDLFNHYNLEENISDENFEQLRDEMKKFDLKNLFKFDLNVIRAELQNKYHAELEILREDFDNRLDELNLSNEKKLREVENKYQEEIIELQTQLKEINSQIVPAAAVATTTQEVVSSGEFEIDEVVQSYERRLQEQIAIAKIDLINALEIQIQTLASSDSIDSDWPEELLRLKDRFSEKYLNEIAQMQKEHEAEIARLKEEHMRNLNGALERARRRSLKDADSLNKSELELITERDNLKKQTTGLRNLVMELLKYFTQCEDELNNTLVEELFIKNLTQIDEDGSVGGESPNSPKRVHLAPNELISLIDNSTDDLDSIDLKGELGICLEKLKSDANAILAMSSAVNKTEIKSPPQLSRSNSLENKVSSLTRQLINETQLKKELQEQLADAKSMIQTLESERLGLEIQLEQILDKQKVFEVDLTKAHDKIAELIENGHKEIISEGYGDNGRGMAGMINVITALHELQEKSRGILEHPDGYDPHLISLLENFSRIGDKLVEEAKRDHEDLRQQIEVADKKYKSTRQFLEEQAGEREQERDEAQKQIDMLKEELKERDKDRASCERVNHEVENLEQQIREMRDLIKENEKRFEEVDTERKEAIEKIFDLREIIRDLEVQLERKVRTEQELHVIISELEYLVKQHTNRSDDDELLIRDIKVNKRVEQLHQHIGDLEGEVQRLRLNTEIAGSEGPIRQFRIHLTDFETTLDKRTKDLVEGLHSTQISTACSSPSEEMSIRDVINNSSNPQGGGDNSSIYEECEVPLQQLARLREKLIRHSRAEDAAVKRIRDLEMQVYNLKADLDENQNEREILKKQIADQLVLISSLQIRLDDQRIRAEHIEKQTNTSLEVRIYDLQETIATLEEKIVKKDKYIAHLNTTIDDLKNRIQQTENELATKKEDELIVSMQEEIEKLRSENAKLKARIDETKLLPNLVENIISDKNNDIDELKEKLADVEKQLEQYSSLNLDHNQIETLGKLKMSGISFIDLLNISNDQMRKMEIESTDDISTPLLQPPNKQRFNDTLFMGSAAEISSIEKIDGPQHHFHSLQSNMIGKPNSTEKHVRFEDEIQDEKIKELQAELDKRNQIIDDCQMKIRSLEALEKKIESLQNNLDETEELLKKTSDNFEKELKDMMDKENELRKELSEKLEVIESKNKDIQNYLVEINNLKSKLDDNHKLSKDNTVKSITIEELNKELNRVNLDLLEKNQKYEELEDKLQKEISEKQKQFDEFTEKLKDHQELLGDIQKLKQDINVKNEEIEHYNLQIKDLNKEIKHLQSLLEEKEKIIDQMADDSRSLHQNLETIQNKLKETGNVIDLGRKLKEEQKKNWDLLEEIHELKAQLFATGKVEELNRKIQKELDYSAHLDSSIASSLSEPIQNIEELQEEYQKEKLNNEALLRTKNILQDKYDDLARHAEQLQETVKKLELDLEKEKYRTNAIQLEDGKLIEQMRIRLDSALNNEIEYEKLLESNKKEREILEQQITKMKQKIFELNQSSKSTDSFTEYKELQDIELKTLKTELNKLTEKYQQLKNDNKILMRNKNEIESALKHSEGLLNLKNEELKGVVKQLEFVTNNESNIKADLRKIRKDLDGKNRKIAELEEGKIKLEKRLDEMKLKHHHDKNKKKKDTKDDLVPENVLKRLKEVSEAVRENKEFLAIIGKLTKENETLKQQIVDLEMHNTVGLPFDDPIARANYLFAKYLRADSYRKALLYQKRYLIKVIMQHQLKEQLYLPAHVMKKPPQLSKFKRAVIAIIAIHRMKYLVQRWHSGKRIMKQRSVAAAAATTTHRNSPPTPSSRIIPTVQFQLGQPVSTDNFGIASRLRNAPIVPQESSMAQQINNRGVIDAQDNLDNTRNNRSQTHSVWTGNTPPAKEKLFRLPRNEPLSAPLLMTQFIERFNDIHETLGLPTSVAGAAGGRGPSSN